MYRNICVVFTGRPRKKYPGRIKLFIFFLSLPFGILCAILGSILALLRPGHRLQEFVFLKKKCVKLKVDRMDDMHACLFLAAFTLNMREGYLLSM